jgi:hypothetical protein
LKKCEVYKLDWELGSAANWKFFQVSIAVLAVPPIAPSPQDHADRDRYHDGPKEAGQRNRGPGGWVSPEFCFSPIEPREPQPNHQSSEAIRTKQSHG